MRWQLVIMILCNQIDSQSDFNDVDINIKHKSLEVKLTCYYLLTLDNFISQSRACQMFPNIHSQLTLTTLPIKQLRALN